MEVRRPAAWPDIPADTGERGQHHAAQGEENPDGPLVPGGFFRSWAGCEIAVHDLLHHAQLGFRQLTAGVLQDLRRLLHSQQPPDGHAEQPAEGNELFNLRQGRVGLPFINCLPAEAKPVSQSFLRESLFFSLLRDALANRHSAPLLLDGISIERAGVLCYQPEGGKLSTSG